MASGLRALVIHLTKVSLGKGLSWQGLGEDVSHVEACRHMMYFDVSFLQVILETFYLEVDMLGPSMLSNNLMLWSTDLTQLTKLSSSASVVDRAIVRCLLLFHMIGPLLEKIKCPCWLFLVSRSSAKHASHAAYILFRNSGYAGVL
jgi:hypothetical protein